MRARAAWLGIGLSPKLWRLCRPLTDRRAVKLYNLSTPAAARLLGVDHAVADHARRILVGLDLDREEKRLEGLGITVVTRADRDFPPSLRAIYDPPAALFYRGALTARRRRVAIVGSRRATAYGRSVATEWGRQLAEAGVEVVSGLARGIDGAAHKGALEGGKTIAVLGNGLDMVYPPEHRRLAEDIAASGALVTEYPLGTPPIPLNFPARNRLVSGLSAAVVIVEAAARSGASITADFALEQGKEVLAVPGPIRSPASAGCHKLLQQGAAVATTVEDIFDAVGWELEAGAAVPDGPGGELSAEQICLLKKLPFEPARSDAVLGLIARPPQDILGDLTVLEINGYIAREPGGWYRRLK